MLEGKRSFFILLVIVAILTLTLAVLAGYILLVAGSPAQPKAETAASETVKRPSDEELVFRKLFEEKQFFNLKTNPGEKTSVIVINIQLQYFKKVKGIKDVEAKITAYESPIKEIIATYFQGMTKEEAEKVETKTRAKEELKKKINELLTSGQKEKKDIIYSVVFDEWFYQ